MARSPIFTAPFEDHSISKGYQSASITDDAEQTLLLARHIIFSPEQFDEQGWTQLLVVWEISVKERGLHDLLGPLTKQALEAL